MATDLRTRTKQFALRIIRLFGALSTTVEAQILGKLAALVEEANQLTAILVTCVERTKE